jgi:hypothetical protein
MSCGNTHVKQRVKLLVRFGKAEPGTIVEADVCPDCGVEVTSKELGYDDHGWCMIPAAPAEVVVDL